MRTYFGGVRGAGDFEHVGGSRHVLTGELYAEHVPSCFSRLHVQGEGAVAVLVQLAVRHLAQR